MIKGKICIECQNRIVFEKFYIGLIAPFRKRDPGNTITVHTTMIDKIQNMFDYAENSYKPHSALSDINLNIPIYRNITVSGPADKLAQVGIHYVANAIIAPSYAAEKYTQASNLDAASATKWSDPSFPAIARQNLIKSMSNQGGAITDIRRQYTDNNTPYFLICFNGLGYGSK